MAGVGWHCNADSSAAGSDPDGGSQCTPNDQNGVSGGSEVVYLTVNDTGFAVGGVDSGSTQSNVTLENSSTVTLTLINAGTTAHDLVVQCLCTPNTMGCAMESCFPAEAGIPALAPGASATTTFVVPFQEGVYPFVSDLPGDTQTSADGGVTGLVGDFVLM
jgi:hypothetical protein